MNSEAKSISSASANTTDQAPMTLEQARAHCARGLPKPDDEQDPATDLVYAEMVRAHDEMRRRADCFDDLLAALRDVLNDINDMGERWQDGRLGLDYDKRKHLRAAHAAIARAEREDDADQDEQKIDRVSAGVTWRDWQLYVVLLSMSVVGIVSKALP